MSTPLAARTGLEMDGLLAADAQYRAQFGGSALIPEFRLLLMLLCEDSVSIKQAFHDTPLSNRAFYLLVASLRQRQLISVSPDERDGRVRLIRLSPTARAQLLAILNPARQ